MDGYTQDTPTPTNPTQGKAPEQPFSDEDYQTLRLFCHIECGDIVESVQRLLAEYDRLRKMEASIRDRMSTWKRMVAR